MQDFIEWGDNALIGTGALPMELCHFLQVKGWSERVLQLLLDRVFLMFISRTVLVLDP